MRTTELTPKEKEQVEDLVRETRAPRLEYHKGEIEYLDDYENVRAYRLEESEALSFAYDFISNLEIYADLIASSLADNIIKLKKVEPLTDDKIKNSFNIMRLLSKMAYYKEPLRLLSDRIYQEVDTSDNKLDERASYFHSLLESTAI